MANELKTQYTTGSNLYAVVLNAAGQAWTGTANVFEAPNSGDWPNYAVALAEQNASGIYLGSFPSAINIAGIYSVLVRQRAGGSAAIGDTAVGSREMNWSGSAEITASAAFSTLTFGSFK